MNLQINMIGSNLNYFRNLKQLKIPPKIRKILIPFKITIGILLIIFGIIGIIIPGIPGWTPLILGVMLISPVHGKMFAVWVYRICKKHIVKFLHISSRSEK